MFLKLVRFSETKDDTLGLLFVDGILECYTLEDEFREKKVPGETRIPAGLYQILFRENTPMANRYMERYEWHYGMLELQDVPGFSNIYIHIGNTDNDTAGCILVGDCAYTNVRKNGAIGRSAIAYEHLYKKISRALERGEQVWISIPNQTQLEFLHEKRS